MKPSRRDIDLHALFNRFAGQEIAFVEELHIRELKNKPGATIKSVVAMPEDMNNPVFQEMQKTAAQNGLSLRLWWPGMHGTMDYNPSRVNISIEKEHDGKYRIQPDFQLG